MADREFNTGVGIETEVLDSFPAELDTANVRCIIYQRSTGYTWDGSDFSSGTNYTSMTRVTGKTWRCTYTANIATTYIIQIQVEGNLRDTYYHYAQGGVTSLSAGVGWNLLQLRTLLADMIKDNPLKDDTKYKAVADNLINLAIQDIGGVNEGRLRFLEDNSTFSTASASTDNFHSLGSTVNELLAMRIISPSKRKLEQYQGGWQDFVREYPEHATTGTPSIYVPWGIDASGYFQVFLYLVPSTTMTVYYEFYKKIGTLSDDSDTPEIPQMFQPLIVIRAAWYHVLTKDITLAGHLDGQYKDGLNKLLLWNRNMGDLREDIPRHASVSELDNATTTDSDYTFVS